MFTNGRFFFLFSLCFHIFSVSMERPLAMFPYPDYIGVPDLLRGSMTEMEASAYRSDVPAVLFCDREIVLYKNSPDRLSFAMISGVCTDQHFLLFVFNTGEYNVAETSEICPVAELWHCIFQPYVDLEFFQYLVEKNLEMSAQGLAPHIRTVPVCDGDTFLIFGDIHGYANSLSYILRDWYRRGFIDKNLCLKDGYSVIGTGDYEDRGLFGIEVWRVLMTLNVKNPGRVYLILGNHEERSSLGKDFIKEWVAKFEQSDSRSVTQTKLAKLFQTLPSAIMLACKKYDMQANIDKYIFTLCCHGGCPIGPGFKDIMSEHVVNGSDQGIRYPISGAVSYAICWTDYFAYAKNEVSGDGALRCRPSRRGGMTNDLNMQVVTKFFQDNVICSQPETPFTCQLRSIIRGHQHVGGVSKLREYRKTHKGSIDKIVQEVIDSWQPLEDGIEHIMQQYGVYMVTSASDVFIDRNSECLDSYAIMRARPDGLMSITPAYVKVDPAEFFSSSKST